MAVASGSDTEHKPAKQFVSNFTNFSAPDMYIAPTLNSVCLSLDAAALAASPLADFIPACDPAASVTVLSEEDPDSPLNPVVFHGLATTQSPWAIVTPWLNFDRARLIPALDDVVLTRYIARRIMPEAVRSQWTDTSASLSGGGRLYIGPPGDAAERLADAFNRTSKLFQFVFGGIVTEDKMVELATKDETAAAFWGGIVVKQFDTDGLKYALRMNRTMLPLSGSIRSQYASSNGLGAHYMGVFFATGATTLQNLIAAAYLNITHSIAALPDATGDALQAAIAPMPYEQYETNDFLESAGSLMPLAIVLGFLYCVSQLTRLLVEEKELRVREAMLIMGLGHVPFYLSWFIPYIVMHVVISAVITGIVKGTFLPNSNGGIIFFLFFFFGLSTISLSVFFSALFSKARIAALVSPVLFFIMAIPSFALGDDAPASSKMGLTILPPSAFGVGCQLLFNYELIGGIQAHNLGNKHDDVPMIVALIMLLVDTLLFLLVGLYLEAVLPSEWGVPMHPLCCCGPWISDLLRRAKHAILGAPDRGDDGLDDEPVRNAAGVADGRDPRGAFEQQPQRQPSVQLLGVRKDFETPAGRMRAVRDLTMDLYEGDVNVVLGHNGAGKTTAISCITGMIDMTEGDCLVYGRSVRHELDAVRQLIGFCPQHNILWPELTCREHLRFYAALKGLTGDAVTAEIDMLLKSVDLLDKADFQAGGMSGGQKRKLSVAIAFCGGSKLVFLDEPTAGMDVGARRFTWDLIRRMSAGRTIVLTTHFMDEADLLGNTISIMSRGMLKCQGSSTFLKTRFGVGYTLSVALAPSHQNQAGHNALVQIAKGFVVGAEQVHGSHAEVIMRLPTDQVPHFPPLLRALEDRAQELGTLGFGVSVTTLEEVFVRIGHDEAPARTQPAANEATPLPAKVASVVEESCDSARVSLPGAVPTSADMHTSRSEAKEGAKELDGGEPLYQADEEARGDVPFMVQLRVLLIKRFHAARRDARTLVLQIVVPILCLIFAMLLAGLKFPDQPPLLLAPSSYGGTESDMTGCAAALATTQQDWTLHTRDVAGPAGLSAYLLSTFFQHTLDRVSGFACNDPAYVVDPEVAVVFSNETFSHGAAAALADFNLMRMRLATGNPNLVVEAYHHPLPFTDFMNAMITAITSILVGIMILVPFTFIPSIYVSFIVKENETHSKHLQQVSGMQFLPYWVSNFIFDFCSFLITDVLAIIVFLIFDRKEYIGDATAFGATASLLLFYTLSSIMMAYAVSFAFTSHSAAQNTVMMTNFVAGFILVLLVFILGLMDSTKSAADPLRFVLRLIPSFALGDGIIKLAFLSATAALTTDKESPFSFEYIGYDLLYMGLLVPFFALLTLFLDHPSGSAALGRAIRHWRRGDEEKGASAEEMVPQPGAAVDMEDPDVAREREEVQSGKRDNDLVVVKNLVKAFGSKVAVKGITFGIHPGEVFGFLGTNGAGKTTTMSILCGQLAPTSGSGWVAGKNVESEMAEVRRVIGYCPQFDAILELLTVEEHLFLFSGLRGLPHGPVQERVVNRLIKMCDLEMHRKKTAGSLSGGNKRKLSVAIALIGAPKVVFLDEPSAGMDPMARHGMWDVIEGMAKTCCVVLTTHHLEEVEALANRVAIMVAGTVKCVGSLQHLKTKFGSGFELTVRLDNEAAVTAADVYIRKQIPNAKMQEQRMTKLTYALPTDVKLSEVFAAIEDQKSTLQIADYTVSQTSLEQVFLRIGGSDALESE